MSVFEVKTTIQVDGLAGFVNATLHATSSGAEQAKQQIIDELQLEPSPGNAGLLAPRFPSTMTAGLYSLTIEEREVLA